MNISSEVLTGGPPAESSDLSDFLTCGRPLRVALETADSRTHKPCTPIRFQCWLASRAVLIRRVAEALPGARDSDLEETRHAWLSIGLSRPPIGRLELATGRCSVDVKSRQTRFLVAAMNHRRPSIDYCGDGPPRPLADC